MKIKATIASLLGAATILSAGPACAFMPQAGTWVVTSENNGQPGRGFGIDVQNNTLVMQMYGYEASGSPTFYLSAGTLTNNQYSAPLNTYSGGRYLGSGDRTGAQTGDAGNVLMRFESGTVGYITFPGETEKQIQRFSFAYNTSPESLKGIWIFSPLNSLTPTSDFVKLTNVASATANGTGLVISTDGRMACEHQILGSAAGSVLCVRLTTAGKLERGYPFTYSVNDGEGLYVNGAGTTSSIAVMRRLGNSSDIGTGITIKDEPKGKITEIEQVDIKQFGAQIEALARQGIKTE